MNETTEVIKKSALAPTVLVSGGAGFVGSHLIEALLVKGARVVVLDNFSTGQRSFVKSVSENPNFTLIECNINEGIPDSVKEVDYVFHIAALESYVYSEGEINLDTLLTNTVGTKNLLDLAKRSGAKFLLVSSIDVYQGMISSEDLSHYFGESITEERRYSYSEAKRFSEALVWEYYKRHKIDARIVRLPEVYGPRMDFTSGNELGRFLKSLINHEDLVVFGDGLEKNYYMYVSDAVNGLMKALFLEDSSGKVFTLSGGEPVTVLELAYLVKSLGNKETNVVFKPQTEKTRPKEVKVVTSEGLKWSAKTTLKEGVSKTLRWYGYEFNTNQFKPMKFLKKEEEPTGITSIKPEAPQPAPAPVPPPILPETTIHTLAPVAKSPEVSKKKEKKPFLKLPLVGIVATFLVAFVIFALLPLLLTVGYANKGYSNLMGAKESARVLDFQASENLSTKALSDFRHAERSLYKLGWVFVLSGKEQDLITYAKLIKISQYASSAVVSASQGGKPLSGFWDNIKPTSNKEITQEDVDKILLNLTTAGENLERAEAELKEVEINSLPAKFRTKLSELSQELPKTQETLATTKLFAEAIPDLLGGVDGKKYLILLQNPNELRGTGGFIGSYAVVSFENSKIKEITIDDIYNVDGLLDLNGTSIPSYEPFATLLKQPYLRIRDANYKADFAESAKEVLRLFELANGAEFDGVIALDIYVVESLLKTSGPLYLTAYNEEITSENVYERAQYHSEALYTEGSSQKKDFLTVLGSKLLETVFSLPKEKVSAFAGELLTDLNEKHILVYLPGSKLTLLMEQENWTGTVNETKGDFLYIVDSNLGANKANYFVKESAKYEVKNTYRDGSLEVMLTVLYEHTGKDSAWPGGPYTDYVRVLVPDESFLHKAESKLGEEEALDITKSVKIGGESGRRTFETSFILQPTQKFVLTFNYTLPSSISLNKGDNFYSLYWQKQPGTTGMPVTVVFSKPFGQEVVSTAPVFEKAGDIFAHSSTLYSDTNYTITLK
ncbi:hypothetical protein A3A70_02985 [candidate division WWE3 bacterium RIFCSPLOWO2_01_FULL_42_11]|uniref:NAD-dependent epimerase/dehydratase domain-containing protein n=1 Tax=candidate division WWE3 bacterium RIFCSPLOWO2_01_FULL_42_11 TaxID=1802627 RepID=A0A1F4VPS4_UNCKA|nr:MAG: hypothetical protein A3A70_02985 [candidate division WWE3 bacterium RIFCSPLOWO2_01_FULL_42_11]